MNDREAFSDFIHEAFAVNPKTTWGKQELLRELMRLEVEWLRSQLKKEQG